MAGASRNVLQGADGAIDKQLQPLQIFCRSRRQARWDIKDGGPNHYPNPSGSSPMRSGSLSAYPVDDNYMIFICRLM